MIFAIIGAILGVVLIVAGAATVWLAIDDYRETPKEDRTGYFENQG